MSAQYSASLMGQERERIFSSELNHVHHSSWFQGSSDLSTSNAQRVLDQDVFKFLMFTSQMQQQATKQEVTDVISKDQSEILSLFTSVNIRSKKNR